MGLAGGVGGVGAPSLVIHIFRFCSQLRLVRPSSTLEDISPVENLSFSVLELELPALRQTELPLFWTLRVLSISVVRSSIQLEDEYA